jgi:adenosylmethionine-8-amino-7-oxononanoate aminotransferase
VPGQAATQEVSGSALLRRSFRKSFPPAVHGEGAYLWDAQGKQYLDFCGSGAVNFIGHGVSQIVSAMTVQARSLEFVDGTQFTTPVAEQYAQELLSFAGENFSGGAVCFCSGGSEALEAAEKLARQYQTEIGRAERSQLLNSRHHKYSGSSFNSGQQNIVALEGAIARARGTVAAIVLESVDGPNLDAFVLPAGYPEKVAEICRRHDLLLIADETISGVGRMGRNFAVDQWNVVPDILVTAKGLSSGYAPLGAVIISKNVAEAISSGSGSFAHGLTYSSHPISLAAGRAVLKYLLEHKLVDAADSNRESAIANELKRNLEPVRELTCVREVRGLGLLWAIDFVCGEAGAGFPAHTDFPAKVAQAAVERGLLVYPVQENRNGDRGGHIVVAPPAVISSYQVSWACQQLATAIEEVSAHA